jgi:class 3 adenylate cyclase
VAERIVSGGHADPFQWHQKDVTVLFVDIHGFTSFVELSKPETVVQLLTDFYSRIAKAAVKFQGTIGHVAGDGVMIFFNDPIEIPNPEQMAVRFGVWLKEDLMRLQKEWSTKSYSLDFGAGISSGVATVGGIGSEGCWDYSVVGTVANVAHRLCSLAKNGQILISQNMISKISAAAETSLLGARELKGIRDPLEVYEITRLKAGVGGER